MPTNSSLTKFSTCSQQIDASCIHLLTVLISTPVSSRSLDSLMVHDLVSLLHKDSPFCLKLSCKIFVSCQSIFLLKISQYNKLCNLGIYFTPCLQFRSIYPRKCYVILMYIYYKVHRMYISLLLKSTVFISFQTFKKYLFTILVYRANHFIDSFYFHSVIGFSLALHK